MLTETLMPVKVNQKGKLDFPKTLYSIYLKAILVDRLYASKKVNQFFKGLYPGEFDVGKPFYQVSTLVLRLITAGLTSTPKSAMVYQ